MKKCIKTLLLAMLVVLLLAGCGHKNNANSKYADKTNWAYFPETLEHALLIIQEQFLLRFPIYVGLILMLKTEEH